MAICSGAGAHGNLTFSNTISFTSAVISNFVWNRHWTYPESAQQAVGRQLGQFFVVNTAGLAINLTRSTRSTHSLPICSAR